jgi:hypothetical protein
MQVGVTAGVSRSRSLFLESTISTERAQCGLGIPDLVVGLSLTWLLQMAHPLRIVFPAQGSLRQSGEHFNRSSDIVIFDRAG